jgi:hypothetical protein
MKALLLLLAVLGVVAEALAQTASPPVDINAIVLEQVRKIPSGGKYAANHLALIRLKSSGHFESGKFFKIPTAPSPSFCSGATYLIFVRTIEELRCRNELSLDALTINEMVIREQKDGQSVWGRWNANGPGTARLFYELNLGRNFDGFADAVPGDFMKIFWTQEVGRSERGHSVIYLGTMMKNGEEYVRFWSSNQPDGYGEKSVPRSKIAHAIFSRFEHPANLDRIGQVPQVDAYLASLLTVRSSFAEAKRKCGL